MTGKESFNSRTPEGCDGLVLVYRHEYDEVSIHAPLKGATSSAVVYGDMDKFQFTHP